MQSGQIVNISPEQFLCLLGPPTRLGQRPWQDRSCERDHNATSDKDAQKREKSVVVVVRAGIDIDRDARQDDHRRIFGPLKIYT